MVEAEKTPKRPSLLQRLIRFAVGPLLVSYFGFLILGPFLLGGQAVLVVKLHGDLPAKFTVEGVGRTALLPELECVLTIKNGVGTFEKGSISEMDYYGLLPTYFTRSARQVRLIRLDKEGRELERLPNGRKGVVVVGMEEQLVEGKRVYFVKLI